MRRNARLLFHSSTTYSRYSSSLLTHSARSVIFGGIGNKTSHVGGQSENGIASVLTARRWATKKSSGSANSTKNARPHYLGIKKNEGCQVTIGTVIARQVGTKWHPGRNVGLARDYTLYALANGRVHVTSVVRKRSKKWGRKPLWKFIHVLTDQDLAERPLPPHKHKSIL